MVQDVIKVEDDKWTDYYVLMVQQAYYKEIGQAIGKVKGDIPETRSGSPPRRRKRGYWTPSGFYWFKRKKKWRNYKKRTSNGNVALQRRKG